MAPSSTLGKTLIIVNPCAQSGAAATVGEQARRFFSLYLHDDRAFDLVKTERPRHATQIAAGAAAYDTVLALGGDGIIHETVCGLMQIDERERPALGIIPVGSGNDYARTLGIEDRTGRDLAWLFEADRARLDIGRIDASGREGEVTEYFMQTFSMGLDAAIAIGTFGLRKLTGLTGDALYLASGLHVFGLGYRTFPMRASFDGEPMQRLESIITAVQIGRTYGSGFLITPDADPQDGLFDVCYAHGRIPRAIALPVFLRAKEGRHLTSRHVLTRRASTVRFEFDGEDYPMQADGEQVRGREVAISMVPGALEVLVPRGWKARG